ncbi:hypothetical protein TNCV_3790341 [Trichonephila clavipes]|nr:hypothetical protein TNCV_3790341 [Trichonephila clavipes]
MSYSTIATKIHRVKQPMHTKSVEVQSPPVEVLWQFGVDTKASPNSPPNSIQDAWVSTQTNPPDKSAGKKKTSLFHLRFCEHSLSKAYKSHLDNLPDIYVPWGLLQRCPVSRFEPD